MAETFMRSDTNAFRVSYWPILRFMWIICFTELIILSIVNPMRSPTFLLEVISFLVMIGAAIVVGALGAWAISLVFSLVPNQVKSDGLSSSAFGGCKLSASLSWAEMERVRPVPFTRRLGIPCLIVHSFQKGRRSLFVPLFLAQRAQFEEAVREAASPLNPLRQSLENGGEAAERTKIPT